MKNINLTERERDFLISITEYFEESNLINDYTITRKGYKFTKNEMEKLQNKMTEDEAETLSLKYIEEHEHLD
ncbi:hypothetical protein LCGC14_2369320 [marine sediment metagenome]|uniref:Uncharacterized protein n=1 Tax=marine sediment metagenome TaxID=412755 RepID=A0A0F9EYX6_9ZZZZ